MDLSDVFWRYIAKNVKRNAENSVKIDRFRESGMEPCVYFSVFVTLFPDFFIG